MYGIVGEMNTIQTINTVKNSLHDNNMTRSKTDIVTLCRYKYISNMTQNILLNTYDMLVNKQNREIKSHASFVH